MLSNGSSSSNSSNGSNGSGGSSGSNGSSSSGSSGSNGSGGSSGSNGSSSSSGSNDSGYSVLTMIFNKTRLSLCLHIWKTFTMLTVPCTYPPYSAKCGDASSLFVHVRAKPSVTRT